MTLKQRAAKVWASQGRAAAMLTTMTDEEIERLALLVDDDGKQIPTFRHDFLQFYADYFDVRKAAADEPTVIEE